MAADHNRHHGRIPTTYRTLARLVCKSQDQSCSRDYLRLRGLPCNNNTRRSRGSYGSLHARCAFRCKFYRRRHPRRSRSPLLRDNLYQYGKMKYYQHMLRPRVTLGVNSHIYIQPYILTCIRRIPRKGFGQLSGKIIMTKVDKDLPAAVEEKIRGDGGAEAVAIQ